MNNIELQNKEFDRLTELAAQWRRLQLTPVVDDDYPEVRHYYEGALHRFVTALRENRPDLFQTTGETGSANGLTFAHLAAVHLTRALRWHGTGLESWSLSDWACAMAGEAGEVCNVVKKMNRARDGIQGKKDDPEAFPTALKHEIGDTLLYLDLLAQRAGFSLEECVRDTFNRVSEREGFPERL